MMSHNPLFSVVREALIDNSDALAPDRRRYLAASWFDSIVTSLISGIYFTGLLLAAGADDIFIGYVQMATTFCGTLFGYRMIHIQYMMILPFLGLIFLSVWIVIAGRLLQKPQ